jgi:thiol:disulfide interchange protein
MWWLGTGLLALSACGADSQPVVPGGDSEPVAVAHEPVTLDWEGEWAPAARRAEDESKAILVDFYADWCLWCRRLETTTFADPKVGSYLSDNVIPLKLDVEGSGVELAEKYRVNDLPTIVVLAADGSEIGRIVGYMSPSSFLGRLEGILAPS